MAEAVAYFKLALELQTKEERASEWARTHYNLALAAIALEDWPQAAESYQNVLTVDPNNVEAYHSAYWVLHEKLHSYEKAFLLNQDREG